MSKNKKILLRAIGQGIAKNRVHELCKAAEFSVEETTIMLDHYCEPRISGEAVAEKLNLSVAQVNTRKEWLVYKLESFLTTSPNFLNIFELRNVINILKQSSQE